MADTARPSRADAVRNRARILRVAGDAFATDGLAVAVDEIAQRAGVGSGTIYRHFPTKESLAQAVHAERMRGIIESGNALLHNQGPEHALFAFISSMVLTWGADRGLTEALAASGFDFDAPAPDTEQELRELLGTLLQTAQRAGAVRPDVTVPEIKALVVGCQAVQTFAQELAAPVTRIALDGLRRPNSTESVLTRR